MLDKLNIENILFLDIETVPCESSFDQLSDRMKELWAIKTLQRRKENESPEEFYRSAGIFAEFGKIICISAGYFKNSKEGYNFRITSFTGDDEFIIIKDFFNLLNHHFNKKDHSLCAHNGKEFDYPYIARRALINNLKLPDILDLAGKKPWESGLLDTLELWKFGDFKNYTSLNLLATVFNIPTPKDDIDGSKVYDVYWKEKDLKRIINYCQKDVLTVAQLFLRFRGESLLKDENIHYI
jgi:predicted PolB exonuclease-like 3'-5' exonuclease